MDSETMPAASEVSGSEERLLALESFARIIAPQAGAPWIDDHINQVNAILANPEANPGINAGGLNRLLAILLVARQNLPATSPPPAAAAPSTDTESTARKQLIDEGIIEDRTIDRAKSYEQVIVGLGYGAFFALWSTMAPKLTKGEALLSGSLMGISLLLYISLHLFVMVWQQTWQIKVTETISDVNNTFTERLDRFRTMQFERYHRSKFLLVIWRVLFPLQLVFGFLGAIGLVFTAIATILR